MPSSPERAARRLAATHGRTVVRPVRPAGSETFPLTYLRVGPRSATPILVIPGGPGMASAGPYGGLLEDAARRALDVILVEHRGVGLSRRDAMGVDLPREAVTVENAADDLAAVLDDAGVDRAVVYGTSYGTYLAQALMVRHPGRVESLVLDSPMLSVADDLATVRAVRREKFWDGDDPTTAPIAEQVRALAEAGVPMRELVVVTQTVYEFAGPEVLLRLLLARRRGRLGKVWSTVAGLSNKEITEGVPFVIEPDLVSGIAYGQLGYGLPPDGLPMDPQLVFADAASAYPSYTGEPLDLVEEVPGFDVPVTVVSGERDLRTPREVARRIVDLAPRGVLVGLAGTGHSALDTHRLAALAVAHAALVGEVGRLPEFADRIAALPRRGPSHLLGPVLSTVIGATTPRPR